MSFRTNDERRLLKEYLAWLKGRMPDLMAELVFEPDKLIEKFLSEREAR